MIKIDIEPVIKDVLDVVKESYRIMAKVSRIKADKKKKLEEEKLKSNNIAKEKDNE